MQTTTFNLGALIGRLRKAFRREFEAKAVSLDITAAQLLVLKRLWEGDGIPTCTLTQEAGSDGGTVTGILDRLEAKDLIRRERSAHDRRSVRIWLTPQGRELEAPLLGIIQEINTQALEGLDENERQQFMQLLEKVGQNLNA